MAKMDHEKANRLKNILEKGYEPASQPDSPIDQPRNRRPAPFPKLPSKRLSTTPTASSTPTRESEKRKLTAFEDAYLSYLLEHARAAVNNQPLPYVPNAIKKRYQGPQLASWMRRILRTERYALALKKATKEKEEASPRRR